jgi:hypothetical protein
MSEEQQRNIAAARVTLRKMQEAAFRERARSSRGLDRDLCGAYIALKPVHDHLADNFPHSGAILSLKGGAFGIEPANGHRRCKQCTYPLYDSEGSCPLCHPETVQAETEKDVRPVRRSNLRARFLGHHFHHTPVSR